MSENTNDSGVIRNSGAGEDAELRRLIADHVSALCARDLPRLARLYAPMPAVVEAPRPFQARWANAWRKTWEACLPYVAGSVRTRIRDLAVSIRGDIALARWSWRLAAEPDIAAAHTWFPGGAGYRKIRGKWQIVHEHASVPLR
jgi:ketosteroid isomerase-like protein